MYRYLQENRGNILEALNDDVGKYRQTGLHHLMEQKGVKGSKAGAMIDAGLTTILNGDWSVSGLRVNLFLIMFSFWN